MTSYSYWDNSKTYHGKLLWSVVAKNITEADYMFEQTTGQSIKNPFIGCQIRKVENC